MYEFYCVWVRYGYVNYKGSRQKYIYCKNQYPFDGWNIGEYIEIDNHRTSFQSNTDAFVSAFIVKFVSPLGYADLFRNCNDLKHKHDKLEREHNDLRTERDNWKKKYEDMQKQLSDEKINNANSSTNERLRQQRNWVKVEEWKHKITRKIWGC